MEPARTKLPTRIERLPGDGPVRFRIAPAPWRDRGGLVTVATFGIIGTVAGAMGEDPVMFVSLKLLGPWLAARPGLVAATSTFLGVASLAYAAWRASRIFFEWQEVNISKDGITLTTRLPLLPARVKRLPVEAGAGARWLPAAFGLPPRIELPFGTLRPLILLDEQEASALVAALRAVATPTLPPASGT